MDLKIGDEVMLDLKYILDDEKDCEWFDESLHDLTGRVIKIYLQYISSRGQTYEPNIHVEWENGEDWSYPQVCLKSAYELPEIEIPTLETILSHV